MVDRPQFTDEQRAFVVLKCEKYKASALDTKSLSVSGSLITLHKSSWDSEQNSHEGKRMNHFIWLVLKIFNVWEFEALSKNWGGYLESFQSPDLKWDPFWAFSEKNVKMFSKSSLSRIASVRPVLGKLTPGQRRQPGLQKILKLSGCVAVREELLDNLNH